VPKTVTYSTYVKYDLFTPVTTERYLILTRL